MITVKNSITFDGIENLSLRETLDCGQAFRWREQSDGSFQGVAFGQSVQVKLADNQLTIIGASESDRTLWENYFDLSTDYGALKQELCQIPQLAKAVSFAPGIRVLGQDGFEALISFIISQNNNIKRIKEIIARLCQHFGEPLGEDNYAFPTPEKLATLTVEDLAPLKAGFRARYILDASRRVARGEIPMDQLHTLPIEEARTILMSIVGVGRKVADCTLLYGFHRVECYPTDVWIKRIDAHLFPDGFPKALLPVAGLAQQYLFHYARLSPEAFADSEK